jgi:hypothetical protein
MFLLPIKDLLLKCRRPAVLVHAAPTCRRRRSPMEMRQLWYFKPH